uniref:Uncharacterized protein n=1 Tax=Octopus bimaculoides TaxID=37653 RepID=A0A0L8IGC3_OCTBM
MLIETVKNLCFVLVSFHILFSQFTLLTLFRLYNRHTRYTRSNIFRQYNRRKVYTGNAGKQKVIPTSFSSPNHKIC